MTEVLPPSASGPPAPTADLQLQVVAIVTCIYRLAGAVRAQIAIRPPPRFVVLSWRILKAGSASGVASPGWPIWTASLLAARRFVPRGARRVKRYKRDPSNMVAAWEVSP